MVCTGAKSEIDCKRAAKKVAKIIKNLGFEVKFSKFRIVNIVASADLGFKLKIHHTYHEICDYDPELFPGLVFRILSPKVTVMFFANGKITLLGGKTREEIQEAYDKVISLFKSEAIVERCE